MLEFVQPIGSSGESLAPFAIDQRDPALAAAVCASGLYKEKVGSFKFFSSESYDAMTGGSRTNESAPVDTAGIQPMSTIWYRLITYLSGPDYMLEQGYSIFTTSNEYTQWARTLAENVVAFRLMPNQEYNSEIYEKRQLFFIQAKKLRYADVVAEQGEDSEAAKLMREHNTLIATLGRDGRVYRHEINAQNVRF